MIQTIVKRSSRSVTTQLRITLAILLLFSIGNVVSIRRQIDSTTHDARIVNYTGIVRGKTQRLVKLAFTQPVDTDRAFADDTAAE
ncbi:MAG: hypothetical protein WBC73_20140, partial [Phormidesmis sp.]